MCIVCMIYVRSGVSGSRVHRGGWHADSRVHQGRWPHRGRWVYVYIYLIFSFVLCLSSLVHMCIFVRSSFSWPRVHRGGWHAAPETTEAGGMQSPESTEAGGTQLQSPPRRVACRVESPPRRVAPPWQVGKLILNVDLIFQCCLFMCHRLLNLSTT